MTTYVRQTGDGIGCIAVITGHLASYGIELYSSSFNPATETLTIEIAEPLLLEYAQHLELTLVE